ncbi:HIT domain-containing protein [bacterium]|nr:HIT domain-containing protein [bacterium]
MKTLWAPWRYTWIKASKDGVDDCFICDAIKDDPSKDKENLLLHRGGKVIIIMNRYPYTNGHVMVAPINHVSDPRGLIQEEMFEIGDLTQVMLQALTNAMGPHGFNIGYNIGRVAGAGLEPHLHEHIVPRWNGDNNFMPVLGENRVISQDLFESYDQLKEELRKLIIP